MRTGRIGYMHALALPVLLPLAGCFGIPASSGPIAAPPNVAASGGVCTGSDADTTDLDSREATCFRELGQRASRKGNVLSLTLDDGTTKTFRSDPEACKRDDAGKCVRYHLVGFHPASGRYFVYVQGYEDHECRLVSARTGKVTKLMDVPHFAPDGSTFFVSGYDNTYANWISIWTIMPDPAMVWEGPDKNPRINWNSSSWEFERWIDNDQIALRNTSKSERCPHGDCEAILKRTGSSWTLERIGSSWKPESGPTTSDPK